MLTANTEADAHSVVAAALARPQKPLAQWRGYVLDKDSDADAIARELGALHFTSAGRSHELIGFEASKDAPTVLISPGSGGHAYLFAELAHFLYLSGFNVFVMPRHGGLTIDEIVSRHRDAVDALVARYRGRIGVFGEGLGGFAVFYLALAGAPVHAIACQNAPAILDEPAFEAAVTGDDAQGRMRRRLLPVMKTLAKRAPQLPVPIRAYLDFRKMIDSRGVAHEVEARLIEQYLDDRDFDRRYPLRAVLSLLTTPPPRPLASMTVPTMFVVARRGFAPTMRARCSCACHSRRRGSSRSTGASSSWSRTRARRRGSSENGSITRSVAGLGAKEGPMRSRSLKAASSAHGHSFGWSFSLGRVFGIELRVHATFLILLAWIALGHLLAGHGAMSALLGAGTLLAVFAIVVMHELSHALVARRFGIATRDITLLPIGGVASLEKMPEKPIQELLVAFAGPALNIVLAALTFVALKVFGLPLTMTHVSDPAADHLLTQLFWVNVMLAGFNLLPAFPMDGGRVLRALLAMRMDRARATAVAARVGRALAVALGIAGLFVSPMLVFVAFFVWVGAGAEAEQEVQRSVFHRHRVRDATITELSTLAPAESLSRAVELTLRGFQTDFPVVDDGRVVGVLTQTALVRALAEHRHDATIRDVMSTDVFVVSSNEPLDTVLEPLAKGEPVLVGDGGRLEGMVTADNLRELLLFDAGAAAAAPRRAPHAA